MKVIPRLDVFCLYKQTRQVSAILRVQNSDVIRTALHKYKRSTPTTNDDKKKILHFKTRCLTARVTNV